MKVGTTNHLIDTIIEGIQERKGKEIVSLNFNNLQSSVCEYFVICEGSSNTQVEAIAESIQKKVKNNLNENAITVNGRLSAQWVLLDYGSVVVHVFQKEYRDLYKLESLWADARIVHYEEES